MTAPITGTTTTTANTAGVVTENKTDADKDMFMKLLVAQMKYQNPMEPTDPTAFLTQSAQFTMIEKLDELTQQGEAKIVGDEIGTSAALIGKTVQYPDPDRPNELDATTGKPVTKTGVVTSVIIDPVLPPVFKLADGSKVRMLDVQEITQGITP